MGIYEESPTCVCLHFPPCFHFLPSVMPSHCAAKVANRLSLTHTLVTAKKRHLSKAAFSLLRLRLEAEFGVGWSSWPGSDRACPTVSIKDKAEPWVAATCRELIRGWVGVCWGPHCPPVAHCPSHTLSSPPDPTPRPAHSSLAPLRSHTYLYKIRNGGIFL